MFHFFFLQDPEEVMKMDEETVKKIQEARSIFQLKRHATDDVTDFVCILIIIFFVLKYLILKSSEKNFSFFFEN